MVDAGKGGSILDFGFWENRFLTTEYTEYTETLALFLTTNGHELARMDEEKGGSLLFVFETRKEATNGIGGRGW